MCRPGVKTVIEESLNQATVLFRRAKKVNKPFPSSLGPQYQSEVKCSAFDMEIIFHSHANKTIFTRKIVHLASF